MTRSEYEILCRAETQRLIEQYIDFAPEAVALSLKTAEHAIVASAVKYLQRARTKLPSYYAARCIITDRAYEQSSSELCASSKHYSGNTAIDLTCGLGVDSFALSKSFKKVISVERDDVLADIARTNFKRLGANNIEVVTASAEQFIATYDGTADLIYADPDRRGTDGKRVAAVEECSPDMTTLMPLLRRKAPLIVLKLSPMLDTTAAVRMFQPCRAEALSESGECKELIIETGDSITTSSRRATIAGSVSTDFDDNEPQSKPHVFEPQHYRYIILSDVALRKVGCAKRYLDEIADYTATENGYAFSRQSVESPLCRALEIESIKEFAPKELKRTLKAQNIRRINILKREFPLSTAQIAHSVGVTEGGKTTFAFTQIEGKLWQIRIKA